MKFHSRILAVAALVGAASSATPSLANETITISSWGGAYQKAQREAWFNVVEKELGITIKEDTTSGVADVRAQVASGRPTWDLVQQGNYGCAILDKEGNTEPLSQSVLAIKGIPDNMKGKGWISNLVYATTLSWSDEKYKDKKPSTWADLWDTKTFPGGRTLRRSPVYGLEAALIADGVPMDKLYPLDTKRAFKKLEEIKKDVVVWWASGAQSAQVLKDREIDMGAIWNGRVEALAKEGEKVGFTFSQQMLLTDCWVIPKGAKNKDLAMKAIEIMSRPEVQARIALHINYGPANSEAFNTGVIPPDVAARLPSAPENAKKGFVLDANYWAENLDELTKQFDLFIQR